MGLADVNGPNDLVNDALEQIETQIFSDHWVAASSAKTELRLVKERIQAGEDFDSKASLLPVYTGYLESIKRLLKEKLSVLVEIGVSNPEYVSSNPARWAHDLLRPYAWGMMEFAERNFLHDFLSLLNDEEETIVSLRTDFYVEIDNSLAIAAMSDAVIQLARRGYRGVKHQS
jgi:hypothetical protein